MKTKQTKFIPKSFRLTPEIAKGLSRIALQMDRSENWVINYLIAVAIADKLSLNAMIKRK